MISNPTDNYYGNIEELRGRKGPGAVKAVAKEMEALFAYELIKAMRETTGSSSKDGLGGDAYMSMFDTELAKLFSERGLGLQEMLLQGLTRAAEKSEGQAKDAAVPTGNISDSSHGSGSLQQQLSTSPPYSLPLPPRNADSKGPSDGGNGTPLSEAAEVHGSVSPVKSPDDPLISMPVHGRISSSYGMRRHPILGKTKFHTGVDIAAPSGAAVHPVRGGKVIFSGRKPGYGNTIVIQHEDGMISRYSHNKKNLAKEGDIVNPETVIAEVGSTGLSTGPHLHLEVSEHGRKVDPMRLFAKAARQERDETA